MFGDFSGTGKVAIVLGTGAGYNNIHDNVCDSSLTACIQINAGVDPTNIFHNNYPEFSQVLTANSATPSVGNSVSGRWDTANTIATSITNFTDGMVNQRLTILVNDANTTFQNGANIWMKGGINYTPASGVILSFVKDASIWREVSRSA